MYVALILDQLQTNDARARQLNTIVASPNPPNPYTNPTTNLDATNMHPYIWIPATLLLCYRAYSHASLTPAGIATAALTAVAHGIHPWNLPFVLLVVFFLAGTKVTKGFDSLSTTYDVY